METPSTKNQRRETRPNNSSSDNSGNVCRTISSRTLFATKEWYVKPILNPAQKTMGRILENADLRTYKQRLNKIK